MRLSFYDRYISEAGILEISGSLTNQTDRFLDLVYRKSVEREASDRHGGTSYRGVNGDSIGIHQGRCDRSDRDNSNVVVTYDDITQENNTAKIRSSEVVINVTTAGCGSMI